MKLPSQVKLMEHTFDVERERAEWNATATCFGCCEMSKQRMYVSDEDGDDVQAVTTLHEIVHLISSLIGYDIDEYNTDRIAIALLSLIRNNPELIKAIQGEC